MSQEEERSINLKDLFVPLTTTKSIFFIITLGIIVFFNSLFGQFIGDDIEQIVNNQFIHSVLNLPLFFVGGTFSAGGGLAGIYYKPVLSFIFSVIYTFFGATPFFFHSTQLLIHITNTILLYVFFTKFLKKYYALPLSLIFLIHPLNSESVIYISGMQEPLFFFFGITSLLILTKNKITDRALIISQTFLLLSLFSKETGILFVAVTSAYVFFFKNQYIKYHLFFTTVMMSIYFVCRFLIAHIYFNQESISPIMKATFFERIISIPAILFYYFTNLIFPKILLFSQQWVVKNIDFYSFILPLFFDTFFIVCIALIIFFTTRQSQKLTKPLLFFCTWFLIGFFMHLQLIPLDSTVADRWVYFPMVGMLGIVGLTVQAVMEKSKYSHKNTLYLLIVLSIVFIFSIRTIVRNSNWSNPITLYTHDIPLMPPNYILENALAYEYLQENDFSNALIHAKRSVSLSSTYINLTTIGAIYAHMQDIPTARIYIEQATEKGKNFYIAYQSLAAISCFYDPPEKAIKLIQEYITKFPTNGKLYTYLAIAYYRGGDKNNAEIYATKSCQLLPDPECVYVLQQIQQNLPIQKNN